MWCVADAGYWHNEQMDELAADGIPVLIPPDASKRKSARPGWDGGRYAWMRGCSRPSPAASSTDKRQATIEPVFGQTKFNRKIDRFQRRGRAAVCSEWRLSPRPTTSSSSTTTDSHRNRLKAAPGPYDPGPPSTAGPDRRARGTTASIYPTATASWSSRLSAADHAGAALLESDSLGAQLNSSMVRDATAGSVPPASGVIVRAVDSPAGLLTESTELTVVVVTSASPAIWLVPVALPYMV